MIKATSRDKQLVTDLLVKSFEDNQSVNYIIHQDKNRLKRIHALMAYSFEICQMSGEVVLSDDNRACALILYPHKKRTSFKSIYLDIKLVLQSIGLPGLLKVLKREALIKKKQPKEEMAYLWFIGVDPLYQQSGVGSWLLQQVFVEAGKKKLPVYLETSTLRNLPWYKRFGFQIYDELNLGYTLYFLKRLPSN
ncbi:GNAT family N-acetyltransferase [Pedobacter sp. ISL-68]|uniref:GNAT family N-acetyltransferase n=1 Tax=unclassified Pedobacter TaxID=2628915 RepID=UPI001BEAD69F|nr:MULTISPECIES: GNAT family N-acetyltransferase [unclassified Pedobacter]MBT2560157.1 GNAT family N-acetyltransferase [Pedobacter sp. ISL-64]MBT2589136.1 GNAT family N-acetyltransferase [Pedobacter sp. ISL-68]